MIVPIITESIINTIFYLIFIDVDFDDRFA
jgi:hypothetical protein